MKKTAIKRIGLALAAGVLAASLAGCGSKINGNETALVINGEEVALGEANFILRYQQAETYYYMQAMGMSGENMWSSEMSEGQTYGEYFKDSAKEQLTQLIAVRQKASGEYGVTLTEEEETQIADAAQQFMDANPQAGDNFGVTKEQVEDVLRLYTYNNDIKPLLVTDVDTEVSDEEAAQSRLLYVRIAKHDPDHDDAEEENAAIHADCEELLAQLQEKTDLDEEGVNELADTINEDFFAMEYSYGADDTSLADAVKEAASALSDGELSTEIIDTDDYYYLVKLIAAFDEEATETKKQSIVHEREHEAIDGFFEEWTNAAEVEEKKCWQDLKLLDNEVYTVVTDTAGQN